MPCRFPRRALAAPFVVTVAAACGPGDSPPPKTPDPEPTVTASSTAAPQASITPPTVATTAPSTKPPEPVDPTRGREEWSISKEGKTCSAEAEMQCPEGVKCNPPPPLPYPCPSAIEHYPAVVVREPGAKQCTTRIVSSGGTCPPGAHCNPPPPHLVTVPCPE